MLWQVDHFANLGFLWEGNIKVNLKEIGWKGLNYKRLAKDRDTWRTLVDKRINFGVL
jgi:hypothetical protein